MSEPVGLKSVAGLWRVALLLLLIFPVLVIASPVRRPNVLFISVDDLRPELGCYGAAHVVSPNIDGLAAEGVLFERAYCQQALCNPSRTSLMTGMRPETVGVQGNHVYFRDEWPEVATLPEHFKNHGYHSVGIGKLYHGPFPSGANRWDTLDDPPSWSEPAIRFGPRYYFTEEGMAAAKGVFEKRTGGKDVGADEWTQWLVFGTMTEAPEVADNVLYDGKVGDAAVAKLRELKKAGEPFFLGVGFIKPHTPYIAPKKYWDLYDTAAIPLAEHPEYPAGAPEIGFHGSSEIRRYTDQPKKGAFIEENRRRLKHGYLACVSHIDAEVGRLLGVLEELGLEEETIVVLWGDHGYHLGEQDMWGKHTSFENGARVPLIVRAPGAAGNGKTSEALVELVDLYPTLCDLAGLEMPSQLEGASFVPVLKEPGRDWKTGVFTSQPARGNADQGGTVMMRSLRTDRYRYTAWVERATGEVVARQLYDHEVDGGETVNVVEEVERAPVVAELHGQLMGGWRGSLGAATPYAGEGVVPEAEEAAALLATGFEGMPAGEFTRIEDEAGVWEAAVGHARVHGEHARSGKQSLRLPGGKKRQVVWTPAASEKSMDRLEFWFERWTKREPFEFRVEMRSGDEWETIYEDAGKAVTGSFRNRVSVLLGEKRPEAFRFTNTAPAKAGMMLDDVQLLSAVPMRVTGATTVQMEAPVLMRSAVNPVADVQVTTEGALEPVTVTRVEVNLEGCTDWGDIESVEVLYAPPAEVLPRDIEGWGRERVRFGEVQGAGERLSFSGEQELAAGVNHFWVSVTLKEGVDLLHRIDAGGELVVVGGKELRPLVRNPEPVLRVGYAVRKAGDDGSEAFRIPGLVTTKEGTLIGVYDVRYRGWVDLPGDIDVGMSRSTKGGRSWEPMKVIMDMGDDPEWRYDGIGDPAVLVDEETNTIWVAATWSHGNRSWRGSGPGLEPEETGQFMLVKSEDDGVTWSEPINITKQVKRPEWCFILQGPGRGITMADGTLVFPAQYQDPPDEKRLPHSTIIYSRDRGETWEVGTGAFDDTTEAQVAEIEPGVLMLNCRYNRSARRVVMVTRDMGETWEEHATSREALVEPGSCMAGLLRIDRGKGDAPWLAFSNPAVDRGPRRRTTIKLSTDLGMTWPAAQQVLLDEGANAGYSCLTMVDAETVGILYEGSRAHMTFQAVALGDLVGEVETTALRMSRCFGDQMVLQRGVELPVWGEAAAGEAVEVRLGEEMRETEAGADGEWRVTFPEREASGEGVVLEVKAGGESLRYEDVVVGEVWFCAGQSNMEWTVAQSASGKEALAAAEVDGLRLLHLQGGARGSSGKYTKAHLERLEPKVFCEGGWRVSSAEAAKGFSAVGYYFGRALRRELGVPVGVIHAGIGGTPAEAWVRRAALAGDERTRGLVEGDWMENPALGEFCRTRAASNFKRAMEEGEVIPGDELGPNHSFKPGFMWEAGVASILPYPIRGVAWYQGESNAESPERVVQHEAIFEMLVRDWRAQWELGDFPFLFVQLPGLGRPDWPEFREQQRGFLESLPEMGMAVTIDVGHPTNVHPKGKRPVGERLARWALAEAYGDEERVASGPMFQAMTIEGDRVVLEFAEVGGGLVSSDGEGLRHFEIAGEDGMFHAGEAIIADDRVVVTSGRVSAPKRVRYAWMPYPEPAVNFFNGDGLPAAPFQAQAEGGR